MATTPDPVAGITTLGQGLERPLRRLLAGYGLRVERVADGAAIPGSFWGEPEAGLQGDVLYARSDTPVHSVLHEACHYLCMTPARRAGLDTDAGGDDTEETAVCLLQVLLADRLAGYGRRQAFRDMDGWGYSFRLGSTRAWFEGDAEDALDTLRRWGLVDEAGRPSGHLRGDQVSRSRARTAAR